MKITLRTDDRLRLEIEHLTSIEIAELGFTDPNFQSKSSRRIVVRCVKSGQLIIIFDYEVSCIRLYGKELFYIYEYDITGYVTI